jgi:hypothetical protein
MSSLDHLLSGQPPRISARGKGTAYPEETRVWSLPDDHQMPIRAARRGRLKFNNPGTCPTLQPLIVQLADLRQAFLQVPNCGPDARARRSGAQCIPDVNKLTHHEYLFFNAAYVGPFLVEFEKRA